MGERRRRYTDAEKARFAEQRQATLDGLHQRIADEVTALQSSGQWQAWLRFASGFHRYSLNNTLLIWSQKPDASLIAGYRTWQQKGRQVRRGESAVRILGPVTKRLPLLDETTGQPVTDPSGQPTLKTRVVGFAPVSVFDISQTDGPVLPEPVRPVLLAGQAPDGLWDALATFITDRGYQVSRGDCGGANGFTDFRDREVRVRADVDDAQAVRTLAHEAGHVLLHEPASDQNRTARPACAGVREVEAESVAFMVTHAHGLDAGQYTFAYVAGWAEAAATTDRTVSEVIADTGARVMSAAHQLLDYTQTQPDPIDQILDDRAFDLPRHAGSRIAVWESVEGPDPTPPHLSARPTISAAPLPA